MSAAQATTSSAAAPHRCTASHAASHVAVATEVQDPLYSNLVEWRGCAALTPCCGFPSAAALQVYSSVRKFKEDLQAFPPDYFVCVPLVLDALYNKASRRSQ